MCGKKLGVSFFFPGCPEISKWHLRQILILIYCIWYTPYNIYICIRLYTMYLHIHHIHHILYILYRYMFICVQIIYPLHSVPKDWISNRTQLPSLGWSGSTQIWLEPKTLNNGVSRVMGFGPIPWGFPWKVGYDSYIISKNLENVQIDSYCHESCVLKNW